MLLTDHCKNYYTHFKDDKLKLGEMKSHVQADKVSRGQNQLSKPGRLVLELRELMGQAEKTPNERRKSSG